MTLKTRSLNKLFKMIFLTMILLVVLLSYMEMEKFIDMCRMELDSEFLFSTYYIVYSSIKYPILITVITTFITYFVLSFVSFRVPLKSKKIYLIFLVIIIFIFFILKYLYVKLLLNPSYFEILLIIQSSLFIMFGVIIGVLMSDNN